MAAEIESPYRMTVSRMTVDKLGVKLYDRVSAVLAELIANSYDADATEVIVRAPTGQLLATKHGGLTTDKGFVIEVEDNGTGIPRDKVNPYFLTVGAERRNDRERGDTSRCFGRKVMGRKGVGKLAPFGICERMDVLTSAGDEIDGLDVEGQPARGYLTAHFTLDRTQILSPTDEDYAPVPGQMDGRVRDRRGTLIVLSTFAHRQVPSLEDLERQLAQRFGVESPNWKIRLIDNLTTQDDPNHEVTVGRFNVPTMAGTRITLQVEASGPVDNPTYTRRVLDSNGATFPNVDAGFTYEGRFYPLTGWVAYAAENYKDDLMAGIRIYCRGKIAAQTALFNRKSGFTGEHQIRSYLVGELHADWLDEEEDLIQTDRRDILWSHEVGRAFEAWGQNLIPRIGRLSREPLRNTTWKQFQDRVRLSERLREAFPRDDQQPIRDNATNLAKLIGQTMRPDELEDPELTDSALELTVALAPHMALNETLRQAGEGVDSPLGVITKVLEYARIAELSSFGRIAENRVRVIDRLETYKDDQATVESALQNLIQEAPWLINPEWSPITANQSFNTLKSELAKFYARQTGEELVLGEFGEGNKRADFVLINQESGLQLVEIKRPFHSFENEEMERLDRYIRVVADFLSDEAHVDFRKLFHDFHVTLVCDGMSLSGVHMSAYERHIASGKLDRINWTTFLHRTKLVHEEFLKEAKHQQLLVASTGTDGASDRD